MEKLNNPCNAAILLGTKNSLPSADVQLLLSYGGLEAAQVKDMINAAKRNYVMSHHNRKITHMPPSKSWKHGCFKTYVAGENNKRKEMIASTEEVLFEKLYEYYYADENKPQTLEQVFELLMDYKKSCLNRSDRTIEGDRIMFRHVSKELRETELIRIDDEAISRFLVSDYLPEQPKTRSLRRILQLLSSIFEYGIRKKLCHDNPTRYLSARDYFKYCDQEVKTDEEKAFSKEELEKITADAMKDPTNPRVLISLLAKETGMRIGELLALHTEDVTDDFIHVHRQQVKVDGEPGKKIVEIPYTKDERLHPHNGRFIPLTDEARQVIELAKTIPGASPYLFHDPNKTKMVSKDSYNLNLRRRCKRLGCVPTNNHAFRMAFNSRLIELGFSSADRALILGHEVQTNESHYSLTDKRRLDSIKERIQKKEP